MYYFWVKTLKMLKKVILLCCCTIILGCNNKDGLYVNSPVNYVPIAVCENGFAGEYPCNDYNLLSHFNLDELAGSGTEGISLRVRRFDSN